MGETFFWSVVGQSEETRQTLRCCRQERTYIDANWNRQRWKTVDETNTGGEISWRDKRFNWRKRSQKTESLETSYPCCGWARYIASRRVIGPSRTILWCSTPHDLAKQTSHQAINCCRRPYPLPTCGRQTRASSGTKPMLDYRWSPGSKELGQRMQGVWEKTCTAISADHGTASKDESWNNDESVSKMLCWLRWPLHDQDYSKSFCWKVFVPVYVLSNQSGASRNCMFIEHHRFPVCVQLNGSHQGKTGRSDEW